MNTRKEITTGSDAQPVAAQTKKKSPVVRKKASAQADSKPVARQSAAAVKKKAAAKESAVKENAVELKSGVASKKATSKPAAATVPPATRQKPTVTREQRHQMICDAAYVIASKRPPCTGSPETDWFQAEAVIDMIFDVSD